MANWHGVTMEQTARGRGGAGRGGAPGYCRAGESSVLLELIVEFNRKGT